MKNLNITKETKLLILIITVFSFLVMGCEKIPFLKFPKIPSSTVKEPATYQAKGTIIARVNNMPITLEELNDEVANFNAEVENSPVLKPEEKASLKINTREQKIQYLKDEIERRLLLYQEALRRGFDQKEEIQQALEKGKMDLLVIELVRQEAMAVEVTPKEVDDFYAANKEQLKEPEERRIREIALATEAEARDVLIQLLQGADFATKAKELSRAPSAKDAGDLGFIKRGTKPPQFDAVAFSDTLEVGRVSNIFKGADGLYYIVKLESRRQKDQKPLAERMDEIKNYLMLSKQQQKINGLVDKLREGSKIAVYEGEIK